MIMLWKRLRSLSILLVFVGVSGVLIRVVTDSTPANQRMRRPSNFAFPKTIPISGWQLQERQPLENPVKEVSDRTKFVSGQRYLYQQKNLSVDVQAVYKIETSGNVRGFIDHYTPLPLSVISIYERTERYRPGIGFYLVFQHQGTAYLTSCINPKGESTVTLPQFQRNRYLYDLGFDRLIYWLFNPANLRDSRCLWTHASIKLDQIKPEVGYTKLEEIWFSWYPWWRSNFPKL